MNHSLTAVLRTSASLLINKVEQKSFLALMQTTSVPSMSHHPGSNWAVQDAGPPGSRKTHPWSRREPPSSRHPSAATFMTRTWPKGLRPMRSRTQHTGPRGDRAGLKQLLHCPESWSTPQKTWPSFSCDTRSKIPARIESEEHRSTYIHSAERVWEMPFAALRI